jgi:hypothetical protein
MPSLFRRIAPAILFAPTLVMSAEPVAGPSDSLESAPQRVLFVGNSYTSGIKGALQAMVGKSPHAGVVMEFIMPGGKTLRDHLGNAETMRRITEGKWDVVVLQEQSQTPAVFPDAFLDSCRELAGIITKAGARPVFYMTWGRRDGDNRNKDFDTYESMQAALTKAYEQAARNTRGGLAPAGRVWEQIRKTDPDLGRVLYQGDGSHPSAKGAGLVSLVLYRTLFGAAPPADAPAGGLTEQERRSVEQIIAREMPRKP